MLLLLQYMYKIIDPKQCSSNETYLHLSQVEMQDSADL